MANVKILIVDDEPAILQLLKARLEANGFETITGANGEEALAKAKEEKPNLIVLDVMMPPPNGFQVCRMLKDDESFKHIPIILLTTKATSSDQFWGVEAGADAYVTKPYNSEDLLGKINSLLKKNE